MPKMRGETAEAYGQRRAFESEKKQFIYIPGHRSNSPFSALAYPGVTRTNRLHTRNWAGIGDGQPSKPAKRESVTRRNGISQPGKCNANAAILLIWFELSTENCRVTQLFY